MKHNTIISILLFCICILPITANDNTQDTKVKYINKKEFLENIFNYEQSTSWQYLGQKPCIIDFTASWCGPCRRLSPILDEIAKEYAGKIVIYKVDIDAEPELARAFGVSSVPALLFCPLKGEPRGALGLYPKEELKKAVEDILLNNAEKQ